LHNNASNLPSGENTGTLVRAWVMTLRLPRPSRIGNFHVTYSNQIAKQRAPSLRASPATSRATRRATCQTFRRPC
jgi:hypothetical protein